MLVIRRVLFHKVPQKVTKMCWKNQGQNLDFLLSSLEYQFPLKSTRLGLVPGVTLAPHHFQLLSLCPVSSAGILGRGVSSHSGSSHYLRSPLSPCSFSKTSSLPHSLLEFLSLNCSFSQNEPLLKAAFFFSLMLFWETTAQVRKLCFLKCFEEGKLEMKVAFREHHGLGKRVLQKRRGIFWSKNPKYQNQNSCWLQY